ncbi:hypothetical protein LTR48_004004 [Friedmanniomyces endolithicus]|nr:hypothetical protein LTR48_004004 [Friedmanniomyces endolithicus]
MEWMKMKTRRSSLGWNATAADLPQARAQNAGSRRNTERVLIILTALLSSVVLLLVFASNQTSFLKHVLPLDIHDSGASSKQAQQDVDAFQLHPEEHTFRKPTTITQNWTVSTGLRRPDGVLKQVYLVNNAFPGPTIEARSGDRLVIHVNNALPSDEGVSIHRHGLSMRGANDQDGAVGITQNAVAAGESFIYNFTVAGNQYGTFWWHAHSAVQRADGLFGGLVVHQPAELGRRLPAIEPKDEYLLMAQDWYHRSAEAALDFYMHLGSFGNEPVPDSILLNGVGKFNCSNIVPARPVDCEAHTRDITPGLRLDRSKKNLLRLVNVGAYAGMGFSLGGTRLQPVAVDGGNAVNAGSALRVGFLYPGERVDVEVQPLAGAQSEESLLELKLDTARFKYSNPTLASTQRISVEWHGARRSEHSADEQSESHLDLQKLKAREDGSKVIPATADMTIVLYAITQKLAHLKNVPHGFINNTYWQPRSSPPEPLINLDRTQWDKHQFVPHIPYVPNSPVWVDIVLNNLDEEGHPFHLHGYDFWILALGLIQPVRGRRATRWRLRFGGSREEGHGAGATARVCSAKAASQFSRSLDLPLPRNLALGEWYGHGFRGCLS